jgi:magnesium transporter
VVWIDLEAPTAEEEHLAFKEFLAVHTLTLEDITRLRREPGDPHFPKVEEFPDYLFVVVNPLAPRVLQALRNTASEARLTNGSATTQLSAVLTNHALITHHAEPVEAVRQLRAFLGKHEAQAGRGPDYLFHLVLDAMVDQYAPVLDHIDGTLDDLEAEVFGKPSQQILVRLLQLKRDIILLRKALVYEREVLARLARGEFELIDARETVYYRNVYDHLVRFTELIESSREMVSDLMQTHLSASSNKLNEIMKVLTAISTVVLPMTLVAGVYGMNFDHMPELHWLFGYPFALGLMALTGVGAVWYFRRQKWF